MICARIVDKKTTREQKQSRKQFQAKRCQHQAPFVCDPPHRFQKLERQRQRPRQLLLDQVPLYKFPIQHHLLRGAHQYEHLLDHQGEQRRARNSAV